MLKKIINMAMTVLFSLGLTTSFAKEPVKAGSKKWDPTDKPAQKAFYDEKGKMVNIRDLKQIKGQVLYDEQGNAYKVQKGKIIGLNKKKMLQKRTGPGPVA